MRCRRQVQILNLKTKERLAVLATCCVELNVLSSHELRLDYGSWIKNIKKVVKLFLSIKLRRKVSDYNELKINENKESSI